MQPSPPRILLLTTLDAIGVTRLPQLFHAAGCHVSVLAPRRLAVCRSRYVAQRFFAEADLDIYLEQLRQHLNTQAYDWVIVCDETLLWELIRRRAANAEAIWIDRCLPVSLTNAELIASKHQFLTAAQDMGLPVPALQLCASLADATQAAQQIGYPVILRAEQSLGGSGVRLAESPAELVEHYTNFAQTSAVAVQRYVANARSAMTEVLYDRGRLVAWNSSYLVAGWPTPMAASCVREPMNHSALEPLLQRIGALTGFHGLGGVDWLHDERGQLHLVEFNPRPTPGYHLARQMDVDFAAALQGMLAGCNATQRPQLQPGELLSERAHQYLFPQYLYRAIDDRTYLQMRRVWRDVPWCDPLLVAAHLRRVCGHYLPQQWRERLRRYRAEFQSQRCVRVSSPTVKEGSL